MFSVHDKVADGMTTPRIQVAFGFARAFLPAANFLLFAECDLLQVIGAAPAATATTLQSGTNAFPAARTGGLILQ